MKTSIKLLLQVAIGIATIVAMLMSDDAWALFAIACVGSMGINLVAEI